MIRAIEMGLCPIPVGLTNKVPCIEWKRFQVEQSTEDDVDEWFRSMSNFNVGIVTGAVSGVVVVDADTPEAIEFCKTHGLDSPIRVRSRKGMHYYWRHPRNGMRFGSQHHNAVTGKGFMGCPHLDFKGDGGYVVIPPSISRKDGADFEYRWEMLCDWDDMPTWRGAPLLADVTNADPETFDFSQLNLAGVSIGNTASVRERIEARIKELGRKIGDGEGRNQAMIQFAGEQVRKGVVGKELEAEAARFMDDFFLDPLDDKELAATLRSAEQMDRRNHPSDYGPEGDRLRKGKAPDLSVASPFALITSRDIGRLSAMTSARPVLCDPWLRSGSISQVVGYSGHGKSLFTLAACWNMGVPRTDKTFGPFDIPGPVRTLYLDYENSTDTLSDRMGQMLSSYGDPGENLQIWSQSALAQQTGPVNLLTDAGVDTMRRMVEAMDPELVVIDTIRSAFEGMKENDAHEWARFNRIVQNLRAEGRTVVAVHHANKPSDSGLGREAGSTNQLTALEVQLRIVPVFADEEVARQRAGKCQPKVIAELEKQLEPDSRLVTTIELGWGKSRNQSENMIVRAMGFAEREDGTQYIVWQRSPRQAAKAMASKGDSVENIQAKLAASGVTATRRSIRGWIGAP
jgi:hypothetical protein